MIIIFEFNQLNAELLDGDTIRDFFSNTDFSREGRERHLLGIARMASMIAKHTPVICSFITPYEDVREKILDILPKGSIMAHVSTSLEVCEDRDVKGLYAKARTGGRTESSFFPRFQEIIVPKRVPRKKEITKEVPARKIVQRRAL